MSAPLFSGSGQHCNLAELKIQTGSIHKLC